MLNSGRQEHLHLEQFRRQRIEEHETQNRHQSEIIDEFTVARICRLWLQWPKADRLDGSSKHQFYRQVVSQTTGLTNVRLATVYVVLARMEAATYQDTPQIH